MAESIQISQPSEKHSPRDRIKIQLTQTGMMRGAKLDADTIKLYSARLVQEPFDDVIDALNKISDLPREQYETALPDMGTVLEFVRMAGIARHNRTEAAKDQELIAWECRACKGRTCGYYPKAMSKWQELLYCLRPAGLLRANARPDEICGGNLEVKHREAA